jgi:hypothetical protein
MHKRTFTRAAGVSPPWECNALAPAFGFPRLAYASRSWSGMRALRESYVFQLQVRPEHRCVRERAQHTCVFICGLDTFTTGGLRPPLLVARRSFAVKSDIRAAQTHVHKSGGRQPAVGRETRLRRYECDCSENRRQYVGRSPLPSRAAMPREAYAPLRTRIPRASAGRMTLFAMNNRTFTRAAGVSPPWELLTPVQ